MHYLLLDTGAKCRVVSLCAESEARMRIATAAPPVSSMFRVVRDKEQTRLFLEGKQKGVLPDFFGDSQHLTV